MSILSFITSSSILTLPAPCILKSSIKIKINLNFYSSNFLWCFKRFYEDLKGLHKTFRVTTKKCENKNFKLNFSRCPGLGREALNLFPIINRLSFMIIISWRAFIFFLTGRSFDSLYPGNQLT